MKRYEQFADKIATLIRQGVLAPGERIPSVRQASQRHGISPSTVFQAYYLLENRGLIKARARSGYFVREHAWRLMEEPRVCVQRADPALVEVSELVFSVLDSLQDTSTVPFGSAFPSPELFPLSRLASSMARGLRELSPDAMITDMTAGHPDLRRQIALRYMLGGVQLPLEELVITNGAMEALNLGLQCVTQPGDLVAIEAPAFYASLQVLERLELKAVEIPVHPREGIDLDILEARLATLPIKACWFMSHLQNPQGASLSDERKRHLYALLKRHRLPMLEDDAYAELYFGSTPPMPVKALDDEGLVMHCGSFSKCLAPGYRVGWVAGGRFASAISRLKLMTTLSPSVPAQAAIADYLQRGGYDRHLRTLRHALETQQTAMLAAADRHFPSDTRITRPDGGYFLWVEFPERVDSLRLFRMALDQGVSLAPGPIFSATQGFQHCARLSYGHPWTERSERAMEALERLLASF
ncbi:GntR family transcriptional regulator MpaR [Halomonas icarae]|uniref:Aminotransferase class I/II-fold pyridoxal phosphate-dependent enzyme n=1 Tax=Halomonas icarae TaxID=2691040 RepID=A0A7X5AL63_9GAMM|nr:GntR family transcriptional regulator MpaR [Halomonas icarae]MDR5901126.1 GntR family transcriptional regulator MpaR [Halomonas icarae]NAW11403.1 aminotransferase class I/II-fold pyridoxal phosphate-dependent enzyme [Halomonas icarae]